MVRKKFSPTTNQYYIRCTGLSLKEEKCSVFIYTIKLGNSSEDLKIKNMLSTHNHAKFTCSHLYEDLRCQMIPKEIKDKAFEEYIDGEDLSEIYKILKKDFKSKFHNFY